jgi:hypothetical protein
MLTQDYKTYRVEVCQDLLHQFEAEGDKFLDSIVNARRTRRGTVSQMLLKITAKLDQCRKSYPQQTKPMGGMLRVLEWSINGPLQKRQEL